MVAGEAIKFLDNHATIFGSDFIGVRSLWESLAEIIPGVTEEEVRFAIRFLSTDRQIQYMDVEDVRVKETREWTRLIKYQSQTDRTKIDKAGRLFMKILRHRADWLYEDKFVEMLETAIHSGFFGDIPKLAEGIVSSLRQFNEELTAIRESPSMDEMMRHYETRRVHYSEMLRKCLSAALRALEDLSTTNTQERYEKYAAAAESPPSFRCIRGLLQQVHQAAESLNRNWTGLLSELQRDRRKPIGILRFDRIATEFARTPPEYSAMKTFVAGCCGWVTRSRFVSVADIIGSVQSSFQPEKPASVVFDSDPSKHPPSDGSEPWLHRHAQLVLDRLERGPLSLSDAFSEPTFAKAVNELRDLTGLVGIFTVPSPLGDQIPVQVTCSDERVRIVQIGAVVNTNDLEVRLLTETLQSPPRRP